ncbi:MAG: ATP-binding protein, partial [Acidimicrobiales bacterium]
MLATALAGAGVGQQLTALADAARRDLPDEAPLVPERFADWRAALAWMATMADRAPLAILLDEVPWYVATTRTWPSHLQILWDSLRRQARPPALLLVLTGSAVASMHALVDASGALYGRADDELAMEPFGLPTAAELLPGAAPDAVIEAYAACGGYPLHLRAWDTASTTKENLERLVGAPGGLLALAGERMLADLPEDGGHRRVLHAVGSGARTRSVIGREAGQRLERPLELLTRAGLLRVDRPLASPDHTPGRYELTDTYLRAWYALCWADLGLIAGGQGKQVLTRRWPRWQRHLGWVFEEQARAHAVRLAAAGRLPSEATYGRRWSTTGPQVEIDILGMTGRRAVLVSAGQAK